MFNNSKLLCLSLLKKPRHLLLRTYPSRISTSWGLWYRLIHERNVATDALSHKPLRNIGLLACRLAEPRCVHIQCQLPPPQASQNSIQLRRHLAEGSISGRARRNFSIRLMCPIRVRTGIAQLPIHRLFDMVIIFVNDFVHGAVIVDELAGTIQACSPCTALPPCLASNGRTAQYPPVAPPTGRSIGACNLFSCIIIHLRFNGDFDFALVLLFYVDRLLEVLA